MQSTTDAPADPISQTLRDAMQAHGAGQFDAAEAMYRQVLAARAEHPDALHLLGVLEAQRGHNERAAELIGRAIAANPHEAMFHNNLGNVCIERGRFDEAEALYRRAFALDAGRLDALNNLGVLLGQRGRHDEAEPMLLQVVEQAPEFTDARQNLANLYLRTGRPGHAIQLCINGVVIEPRNTALRRLLGAAYTAMGMHPEATALYRKWLEAEPDNAVARFHLQACTGEGVPDRAPDAYVASVFDSFAGSFDAKLSDLSYQAPQFVAAAVARHADPPARGLDVLDAGCGTGLCGPLLREFSRRLEGVDLSPRMLAKAEARGGYDELACAELVDFLGTRPGAYDVIVSADTLCYFGALEGFAAAAFAALRGAGLLVFTVEAHADESGAPDFRLQAHGRYSHLRSYVEAALSGSGFAALKLEPVVLRMEAQQPVNGWLVSARAGRPR